MRAQLLGSQMLKPQKLRRPVEREDLPAARVGVESVRELRDLAGGLVGERKGAAPRGNLLVQPLRVALRLDDHPFEGVSGGLGLDDAYCLSVRVQKVVRGPALEDAALLPTSAGTPEQPRRARRGCSWT